MPEKGKEYLTKDKYQELKEELDFLKNNKRKEIADELEYAKSLGDLSENAEYNEARENQAKLEARIRKVEAILQNAEIVTHKKSDIVSVGSVVVVQKEGDKEKREFSIVGSEEANSLEGRISHQSPLGKALMGKKAGEESVFQRPDGGKIKYKILKVS